jgi:hypothetical protein
MSTLLLRVLRLMEMPPDLSVFEGDSLRKLSAQALYLVLRATLQFDFLFLVVVVPFFAARKSPRLYPVRQPSLLWAPACCS